MIERITQIAPKWATRWQGRDCAATEEMIPRDLADTVPQVTAVEQNGGNVGTLSTRELLSRWTS